MAICYARLETVKRSIGKNAVAKSAYNGKLRIEFEGNCVASAKVYDWSKQKEASFHHEVILPDNVDKKFKDPKVLWNAVEKAENRKDSKIGKEFVIALPDDKVVSDEQRIELARSFAKKYFISKGYGVQIDAHLPSQQKTYDESGELEKNERNYHAHILITERHFNEDGKSFKSKKIDDLLPRIRGSNHMAFGGIEWGKLWTQFQNEYFEEKGLDLRVDQTNAVSQIHLGPYRMRGVNAYEVLDLHNKREELGKLLAQNPDIILKKITENKSVFTEKDVELFLQKNADEDLISDIRNNFWKSSKYVELFDKQSLLATGKYSSLTVIDEEKKILRLADKIQQKIMDPTTKTSPIIGLSDEQKIAFNLIVKGRPLSCIEGLAGTGKSYLLVALKDHYESNGFRVRAFGPDNATVKVLEEKGFSDVSNIHRFLYKDYFSEKSTVKEGREVWIVDESSKLGNLPLLELLKSAEKKDIKLIFCGNSAQLSSVDRGGMFSVFCERYGYAYLGEIQRQKNNDHKSISKRLATGDVGNAVDLIANSGGFVWTNDRVGTHTKIVEKWSEDQLHFPYSSSLIIAHSNEEVRQLNNLAHLIRKERGEISEREFSCRTMYGDIFVGEGDLIEFRANSKDLGVFNGQQGVLTKLSKEKFVALVEGKEVSFDPSLFSSYQLAYATTYFRSQGKTIDRCYISYNPQMHQKMLYVGMSRHVRNVHCFVSRTDAKCIADIKRQIAGKGGVENTLSYTTSAEIENTLKVEERKNHIAELCSSESLISKSLGYGFKAWDNIKSGLNSIVEPVRDTTPDERFYSSKQIEWRGGYVVEMKEQKLSTRVTTESFPHHKSNEQATTKNYVFQKLGEDKQNAYKDYFDKSEMSASLYAVVLSEAAASSVSKESTASFAAWQEACVERNRSAFKLMRTGSQHKAILGIKGMDILQDRACRYEQSQQPKDSLDIQLKDNIERLLHQLFPDGPQRRDSKGFRFGSKGSLAVACIGDKMGCFYDFETKESGSLLQLIEKKEGLNRNEAIEWARKFLGNQMSAPVPSLFSTAHFRRVREEQWISLMPPKNSPVPTLKSLSKYLDTNYKIAGTYPYQNSDGDVVYYAMRLDPKGEGKKIVLPVSYGKNHPDAEPAWSLKGHSSKRELLYREPLLYKHLEKPVLIVEGEKTTDAAQKLLEKEYIVVSWMGGAAAAKDANWSKLFGRDVIIWPDNDAAGFKAASEIGQCLRKIGVRSLKIVNQDNLRDLPEKWDLADSLPENKPSSFIKDTLLRAESKAIGVDRMEVIAKQYGLTLHQINVVVAGVDECIRKDLEKQYGSKTWEIEAAIIAETTKQLSDKGKQPAAPLVFSEDKSIEKEHRKSIGRDVD